MFSLYYLCSLYSHNTLFSDCIFSGSCRSRSSESQMARQAHCNRKDCRGSGRSISFSPAYRLACLYQERLWWCDSRRYILQRSGHFGRGGRWLLMYCFPSHWTVSAMRIPRCRSEWGADWSEKCFPALVLCNGTSCFVRPLQPRPPQISAHRAPSLIDMLLLCPLCVLFTLLQLHAFFYFM